MDKVQKHNSFNVDCITEKINSGIFIAKKDCNM
jgi:hypothetical protein